MSYNNYYDPFSFSQMIPANKRRRDPEMIQPYNIFIYPENLGNALSLIQQAVSGENEDREFYTYLLENAPSIEEQQIITGIRDNEINHFNMFHQIYYDITGEMVPQTTNEQFVPPATYCEGLKHALLGEQHAVQNYRQILYAMQTRIHVNMLTEIITDEIRHGSLYNYLYAKNGCNV
jgi:rubrerythrin